MKRIIGIGKPRPAQPTISDTIDRVDREAEDLRSKITACDAELVRVREQMKRLRKGSDGYNTLMGKAKLILQRKKKYEEMESNLQQQSFNMEQATSAMHATSTNQQIVSAMKSSLKEIEKANKKITLDEVEDLRDSLDNVLQISDGIQEALGRTFPGISDIDEDQLEAELEGIIMDEDKSYLDAVIQNPLESPQIAGRLTRMSFQLDEFGLSLMEAPVPDMSKKSRQKSRTASPFS